MLVQDLSYMEEVSESSTIEGGSDLSYGFPSYGGDQFQDVYIDQYAYAYAGYGDYNYGNTAVAYNVANVYQIGS